MNHADFELIEPHLVDVKLEKGKVLEEPDTPIEAVYFLKSGVGSTVALSTLGRRIEVGLFGCEGMSGTAIVLHAAHASHETFIQIPGDGQAMESGKLRELMAQNPTLHAHLLKYVQFLMTQTSQTALANGRSKLEERLARWLLMCHDRSDGDSMDLTHEFLAIMLGVRRAGVTVGTHILEGKGLIRAIRGRITILDREGLQNVAQDFYGIPEKEYDRLIGFKRQNRGNKI